MKLDYFTEITIKLIRAGYLEPHQRYGLRPTRKGAQVASAHLNTNDIAAHTHSAYIEQQQEKGRTIEAAYLDATMFILVDMYRSNQLPEQQAE